MKRFLIAWMISFSVVPVLSQDMAKFKLYKPEENAEAEIAKAARAATAEGKHVLVQVGGNWCVWCARFVDFVSTDKSLDSLMNANFVVYHMNYSKENQNGTLLRKYKFPQRFGFPVFLVLDDEGNLLHTQNSWYLEEDKSYDKEKVMTFFKDWGKKAFDPAQYKEQ